MDSHKGSIFPNWDYARLLMSFISGFRKVQTDNPATNEDIHQKASSRNRWNFVICFSTYWISVVFSDSRQSVSVTLTATGTSII